MKTINTTQVQSLKPGMVIMPPAREVSLWMRDYCKEKGFSESAMHLTVIETKEGKPDKNGRWIIVRCNESAAWLEGRPQSWPFSFKSRPETMWPVIQS